MTRNNRFISFVILAVFFLASCSSSQKSAQSPRADLRSNFVFISAGLAFEGIDSVAVEPFWMAKYELTNEEYLEFLDDLKSKGREDDLKTALPDTTRWRDLGLLEPYVHHYLRHPAYRQYPVVNISYEAAVMYCQWLTDIINASDNVQYDIRLPEKHEWMRAAQAGKNRIYAWDTPFLRTERGSYRANFKHIPNEVITLCPEKGTISIAQEINGDVASSVGKNGVLSTGKFITAPVESYKPGLSGLFNMNGNVAEMISGKGIAMGGSWNCLGYDVRNTSLLRYENPSPFVGVRLVMTVKE